MRYICRRADVAQWQFLCQFLVLGGARRIERDGRNVIHWSSKAELKKILASGFWSTVGLLVPVINKWYLS